MKKWGCLGLLGLVLLGSIIGAVMPKTPSSPATEGTPRASAPMRAVAPTREPTATVDRVAQQWGEFLRYGPELVDLVKRSEEINRLHAQGAAQVTTSTVVAFYNLTDQAARSQGELLRTANLVRVPREANDYKQSVLNALSQREDAFNALKTALNRPGVAAAAEYQTAKEKLDRSTLGIVSELFKLCATMQAEPDECMTTVGLSQ